MSKATSAILVFGAGLIAVYLSGSFFAVLALVLGFVAGFRLGEDEFEIRQSEKEACDRLDRAIDRLKFLHEEAKKRKEKMREAP